MKSQISPPEADPPLAEKIKNEVIVVSLDRRFGFRKKRVEMVAKKMLRFLKKKNCYLEIFLVASQKMKFLNKKFRNKNKATDILTFIEPKKFPHPESELKPLGEIYLNQSSVNSQQSLVGLLAHGILHLFGFQHTRKNDRIKMEETEQKLFRQILNPKL